MEAVRVRTVVWSSSVEASLQEEGRQVYMTTTFSRPGRKVVRDCCGEPDKDPAALAALRRIPRPRRIKPGTDLLAWIHKRRVVLQ